MSGADGVTQLPKRWQTERLIATDATEADLDELRAIHDACASLPGWPQTEAGSDHPVEQAFRQGSVPPGGSPDRFRLQVLRLAVSGQAAGILEVYHGPAPGYIEPGEVWIGLSAIDPEQRRQKLGREAIDGLCREVAALPGYHAVALAVLLANPVGLRFWVEAGFRHVIRVVGEGLDATGGPARLALRRPLD